VDSYTPHPIALKEDENGALTFPVRAQPKASRNEVGGSREGALKVRVTAPADRGKANAAIVKELARALGVPRSCVELVRGAASRDKLFRVKGILRPRLEEILRALVGDVE
jgi:uncharacterized protein (TIGR00251 family)